MFELTPKSFNQTLNSTEITLLTYTAPAEWMQKFARLIFDSLSKETKNKPVEGREFNPSSTFILETLVNKKPHLPAFFISSLELLYGLMSGELTDPTLNYNTDHNPVVAEKLFEGLVNCNEGLLNRVNELMQSTQLPTSLEDRIQLFREDLVKQIASLLTDEVHTRNDVSKVAHLSYGVRPINLTDNYTGELSTEVILKNLEKHFNEKFNAFTLIHYLLENMRQDLILRGYSGCLENSSYTLQDFTKFSDYLNKTLGLDLDWSEWIVMRGSLKNPGDEYESVDDEIIDINWDLVGTKLIKKLKTGGFMGEKLHLTRKVDPKLISLFVDASTDEPQWLNAYLEGNSQFGLALGFRWACQHGYTKLVNACLEEAKKDKTQLQALLLAEYPGNGPANGFRFGCELGHVEVVKACFEATNDDMALQNQLLLAGRPGELAGGFVKACANGHTEIVRFLIHAARKNKIISELLLARNSRLGEGRGFQHACIEGFTEIAAACIEAAQDDKTLLRALLLSGDSKSSALGFVGACEEGDIDIVNTCLEAVKDDKNLLSELLLAGNSKKTLAVGFVNAFANGHKTVVKACFEAAKDDELLLKELLLAVNPQKDLVFAFSKACEKGYTEIVKAYLDVAKKNHVLKEVLLGGNKGKVAQGFRSACDSGYIGIVKACLEAAKEDPSVLSALLLAGDKDSHALGFREAGQYNHHEIVELCVEAAKEDISILSDMLLAGNGNTRAEVFTRYCAKGDSDRVKLFIEAAKEDKSLLKELLLAGGGNSSAWGFRRACENGCLKVVKLCLEAAKGTVSIKELLFAGDPQEELGRACTCFRPEVLKLLLDVSKEESLLNEFLHERKEKLTDKFRLACNTRNRELAKKCIEVALITCDSEDLINPNHMINDWFNDYDKVKAWALFSQVARNNPTKIIHLLLQLDSKHEKHVLRELDKTLTQLEKKALTNALSQNIQHLMPIQGIQQVYAHNAGFWSKTSLKIQSEIQESRIIETLNNRSQNDLTGASMKTLLQIRRTQNRSLGSQQAPCDEHKSVPR